MENVTQPWKTIFPGYWLSGTYSCQIHGGRRKMESLATGKKGE